jgi:hypothetical protein
MQEEWGPGLSVHLRLLILSRILMFHAIGFNTPTPDDKPAAANDHTSADPKPDLSDDDTLSDGSIHEFEPSEF